MGKKQPKKSSKKLQTMPYKPFKLSLPVSEYSVKYANYMMKEYPSVQRLLKKLIKLPCCEYYYLRYPLEGMMRGVCKKLMVNVYELTIYAYYLSTCKWGLDFQIFANIYELFPDIIHVNQPTDPLEIKQLSMFLYFSCYSVKELLNDDIDIYRQEMLKIFSQFQHLHAYWVNSQQTTNFVLNPRQLNSFFKKMDNNEAFIDYNVSVDKIIQISPCYDIVSKNDRNKMGQLNFNHPLQEQYMMGKKNYNQGIEGQMILGGTSIQQVKSQFVSEQLQDFKLGNLF